MLVKLIEVPVPSKNHPGYTIFVKSHLCKLIAVLLLLLMLSSSNVNNSASETIFPLINNYGSSTINISSQKNHHQQHSQQPQSQPQPPQQQQQHQQEQQLQHHQDHQQLCPLIPPKLVGRLKVMTEIKDWTELEDELPNIEPGGCFHVKNCTARQKVAIIVPYRDRELHLRILIHNLHPMLQRQQIDYCIFIIEQMKDTRFNRAKLFNIGFVEASKQQDYDCFIFHDVDLVPEDDRNLYRCAEQPRHMSVAINTMKYKLPYNGIFGGVSALSKSQMNVLNGFSNEYWGWGGEDDDMSHRISFHGFRITRYPETIARYSMLRHRKETPNPDRYKKLYSAKRRFRTDGLSSLKYKKLDTIYQKLYTWILVDALQPKK